eukprot:1246579-Rhodomonas_salina.1
MGDAVVFATPPCEQGVVNVTISAEPALGELLSFTFVYLPLPSISHLVPSSLPVGAQRPVLIIGSEFLPGKSMCAFFKDSEMISTSASAWETSTLIRCLVPAQTEAGAMTIEMSNDEGREFTRQGFAFAVTSPVSIFSVRPTLLGTTGGASITLFGENFRRSSAMKCRYGLKMYSPAVWSTSSKITCIAPTHSPGNSTVELSFDGDTFTTGGQKVTFRAEGEVLRVVPSAGPAGGVNPLVYVSGFDSIDTLSCVFGTKRSSCVSVSDGVYEVFVPRNVGEHRVKLSIGVSEGQEVLSDVEFEYQLLPTVERLIPTSGPVDGGTMISVLGFDFIADSGLSCTFSHKLGKGVVLSPGIWVSSSYLLCVTPNIDIIGSVTVEVSNNAGHDASDSGNLFQFYRDPVLHTIVPERLSAGADVEVTITGIHFERKNLACRGAGASVIPTCEWVSSTTITALLQTHTVGNFTLEVSNNGVDFVASPNAIQIATARRLSILPSRGPQTGGTLVTLVGSLGVVDISFGPGNEVRATTQEDDTVLVHTPPSETAGVVEIVIKQSGSVVRSVSIVLFEYQEPATVSFTRPSTASSSTNTVVFLVGERFPEHGVVVRFGHDATPTEARTISSSLVSALAPPQAIGSVKIAISINGGFDFSSDGPKFEYFDLPTVSRVTPSQGYTH